MAMEPMISFDDNEIRNKKVDVLHAIRPIPIEEVHQFAVRGQYDTGWIEGEHVPGYRGEVNVSPESSTETYAASNSLWTTGAGRMCLFICVPESACRPRFRKSISSFDRSPIRSFPSSTVLDWQPNRLLISIQPLEGILLRFQAKHPGEAIAFEPGGYAVLLSRRPLRSPLLRLMKPCFWM